MKDCPAEPKLQGVRPIAGYPRGYLREHPRIDGVKKPEAPIHPNYSLCITNSPGICYGDEAGLKFTDIYLLLLLSCISFYNTSFIMSLYSSFC